MTIFRIAVVMTIVIAVLVGAGAGFATLAEMDFHVPAHGRVEAARVFPVRLAGSGTIEYIAELDRVKADDVLVKIRDDSIAENLALVGQQLALVRAEIEKERGELGNPQRRYGLEQNLKSLELEEAKLRQSLQRTTVRAPFAGKVIAAYVGAGEHVAQSDRTVLLLADESRFVFAGTVTPEARRELAVGQRARVRLDAYPHLRCGSLEGRVEGIESVVEEGKPASYAVTISLDEPVPFPLHIGLAGTADVVVFRGTPFQYFRRDAVP